MLNRELSSDEDTTIPIAAFNPESGTVNLDKQRDACGHVVVSMKNARRAATFSNPLRDPLHVCKSGNTLVLLDGFHRLFVAFSRGHVGPIPVVKISGCDERSDVLHHLSLGYRLHQRQRSEFDQALVFSRTLLKCVDSEENSNSLDCDTSIITATNLLLSEKNEIHADAEPELLHVWAKGLASLSPQAEKTLQRGLARRVMRNQN